MIRVPTFTLALALAVSACAGSSVRNTNTYDQELAFLSAVSTELADEQLEQAAASARIGDPLRCADLAEPALVARLRVPHHVAMARHLVDLAEDPGPPPIVPLASAWCAEQAKGAVTP